MDAAEPTTWTCPPNWHPDWNGPWQFDRLRELATAFAARSPEHRVRLDIIETGYVRVEFFRGQQKLGVAYVNRNEKDREQFTLQLYLGADDHEHSSISVAEAVRSIMETATTWKCQES